MTERYRLISKEEAGPTAWNQLADESSEAWLYHRWELIDALSTWPSRTDAGFGVSEESSGALTAIVPAQIVTEPFAKIAKRKVVEVFGGAAMKNDLSESARLEIRDAVLRKLKELSSVNGSAQISFLISPLAPSFRRSPDKNPLANWNCALRPAECWMLLTQANPDTLWSGLEGRARTDVRKAQNEGVTVRVADLSGDEAVYYQLHKERYQETGARPHPEDYFRKIWENFLAKGLARIFFAERKGRVIAAANISVYKKAAEYWTGASSEEGRSTGANSLLQWEAIKWMASAGIERYNLGEAFTHHKRGKLKGLSDYKKSFGGEPWPLFRGQILPSLKARLLNLYLEFRHSRVYQHG